MVNFQTGLFRVGSLTYIVIHSAGADTAGESRVARAGQRNDVRLVLGARGISSTVDDAGRVGRCTGAGREAKNLVPLKGLSGVSHGHHLGADRNILPGDWDGAACLTRGCDRIASEARNDFLRVGHKEEG